MHTMIVHLLTETSWPSSAVWTAHALLSVTRIDLVDHLISEHGLPPERLVEELGSYVHQLLGRPSPPEAAGDDS